ncbi:hypothetical protein FOZ62_032268 [Perkinsus olseni]|uniref:Uncharacterized protein n=1 Tax=Perkinsus olseni TaxID=32597 RepID=A0A7J6QTP3_PEROL|nr:hypothetical protein FOZ62_032268 [Perkinsus olseni]
MLSRLALAATLYWTLSGVSAAATDCSAGDSYCVSVSPGSYCKYYDTPSLCQGTTIPCSCNGGTTSTSSTKFLGTTTTTTKPTTTVSTTRPPTTSRPDGSIRFGTYSWSQDYWRSGDPSLTEFGASDMAKLWNSGDVYVNIADDTNYDRIHDQEKLLPWMKDWRRRTGNTERIWLTYGDISRGSGSRMVKFVNTFGTYLESFVSAEDMKEIAPIGLSYDVEHMQPEDIKKTLLKAQQMKKDVSKKMGYPTGSLLIDFAIEGQKNTLGTQYIMEYADHATMMLYRNAIDGDYADDLVYRMNYMMTEQCAVCTQPGWENLKAKITIMLEGSCTVGKYCHKLSMCADDTTRYPDPSGGVEYAWDLLNELKARTVSDGILTQEQFDSLYDINGSLYVIHNWEWVRCYYGDDFSRKMGYSDCLSQYHELAGKCRAD